MNKVVPLLALTLILCLSAPAIAQEEDGSTVEGQLDQYSTPGLEPYGGVQGIEDPIQEVVGELSSGNAPNAADGVASYSSALSGKGGIGKYKGSDSVELLAVSGVSEVPRIAVLQRATYTPWLVLGGISLLVTGLVVHRLLR